VIDDHPVVEDLRALAEEEPDDFGGCAVPDEIYSQVEPSEVSSEPNLTDP
jgi:hypothetical protein